MSVSACSTVTDVELLSIAPWRSITPLEVDPTGAPVPLSYPPVLASDIDYIEIRVRVSRPDVFKGYTARTEARFCDIESSHKLFIEGPYFASDGLQRSSSRPDEGQDTASLFLPITGVSVTIYDIDKDINDKNRRSPADIRNLLGDVCATLNTYTGIYLIAPIHNESKEFRIPKGALLAAANLND